ncbi:MAG TPA: trypsin-like peptidase domain-containing protein [Vicinamibacterales bacterium]|nr:trypsin-like peptidase domain-containing protein [Vicinamibacterales bacterium]
MTRRFAWISAGLSATVGMLVGAIVTGSMSASPAVSAPVPAVATMAVPAPVVVSGFPTSFADVAARVNPAVVAIDASSRARRRSGGSPAPEDSFGLRRPEMPRRGTGTGFLLDASGLILTNQHVVEAADRVTVKLADGRTFRARLVGADADTDLALIKVESGQPLPHVTLGNSDALRVGEWVCAIGNPFAYEHTVTVGVVSFVGRKLFDQSLDHYIQTDAAISFGNSGGPLLNTAGEVVGINSAVSRQANNIGFSIPINQAKEVLPQLLATGRVARGYLGVALRDVDADVQQALGLGDASGALVEDVTAGSPAERAGLRSYDIITAINGRAVGGNDMAIRTVAGLTPGQAARIDYRREGRVHTVTVKLAERPARVPGPAPAPADTRHGMGTGPAQLGLTVLEVHQGNVHRYDVPAGIEGLLVQRVEPASAAADAGLERGQVILHINRRAVTTVAALRQAVGQARPGAPVAVLVYDPGLDQRVLRVLHADVP